MPQLPLPCRTSPGSRTDRRGPRGWRACRGVAGRSVVVAACLVQPAVAQDSATADPAASRTTPREIIDRLIATPPAEAGRAVDPHRADGGDGEDAAVGVSSGGLSPDVVQIDPDAPLPRLRREGGFVVERPGRLIAVPDPSVPASSGAELWVFAFDRVPGVDDLRPMIVQKTQRLQVMQDMRGTPSAAGSAESDKTADMNPVRGRLIGDFLVSGQVHTHRGVNYLLPTAVTARPDATITALLDAAPTDRPAETPRKAEVEPRGLPAVTGDAFESQSGATPATFDGSDDPIRQMESLLTRPEGAASTPGDPSVGPVAEGVHPDAGADVPVVAAPRQEGSYLVERRGRVVGGQNGGPVLFTFSADGAQADDPPVVLMPCGLLEELENDVRRADVPPEFALSGRVYAYRGVNHVLPTSYRTGSRSPTASRVSGHDVGSRRHRGANHEVHGDPEGRGGRPQAVGRKAANRTPSASNHRGPLLPLACLAQRTRRHQRG